MKKVQEVTLIQTLLATRGDGETDPIRRITQWWTPTGELVAEKDPCAVVFTPDKRKDFRNIKDYLGHMLSNAEALRSQQSQAANDPERPAYLTDQANAAWQKVNAAHRAALELLEPYC